MNLSVEQSGTPQVSNLPQWINVILGLVSGLVVATAFMIRIIWSLHDRIRKLESRDLDQIIDARLTVSANLVQIIDGRLATDRHDNIYPMMQDRIYRPMDKIEDEQKLQGQNIAVLLERDRIGTALERLANAFSLGPHPVPNVSPRQGTPQR